MATGECITKGGGMPLRATPPFLLALPLLMEFDDLMPLPVISGFQATYKVNNEEV